MRKFFVKNVLFLILVNLIVKPVWIFGIDRNVQNVLGHEAYGQYGALLSFSIIFQILLDFGLQSYNSRTVSQSPKIMQSLFPNIIMAKGIFSVVYFVLIIGLGLLIGYRGHALFLLSLLSFVQIATSFLLYLRSNIAAMHHFKIDSLLSVGDRFLMIFICAILLFLPPWRDQFKIEWFIYAQIFSYFVTGVVAFLYCRKISSLTWTRFNFQKILLICKSSLPYAMLIFTMAIYMRADILLLERLLPEGKTEAGVFIAAYRLLDVANNVSGLLFASILLPLFGRMLAKKEDVFPIVQISVNLLLPLSIVVMVAAWFFGHPIMKMLYTNATDYDGRVFTILMMAFPGFCIVYIYSTLLTANGNLKPLIGLYTAAVVLSLTLNLILIPKIGALGAAITAASTQLLVSILLIKMSNILLHLKFQMKWILQYILFFIGTLIICYGFSLVKTSLVFQIISVGLASGTLMLLCGFLPFQKIKDVLFSKNH